MDMGTGWGMAGMMLWMVVGSLLVVAVVVLGVWWLVRAVRPSRSNDRALEVLRERYARGEITREEFEARRRDLAA